MNTKTILAIVLVITLASCIGVSATKTEVPATTTSKVEQPKAPSQILTKAETQAPAAAPAARSGPPHHAREIECSFGLAAC